MVSFAFGLHRKSTNGSGPQRSCAVSGSYWNFSALVNIWLATSACLSPRFYPHFGRARRPAARWGPSFWWGAAIFVAISMDQDTKRSLPRKRRLCFTSMPAGCPLSVILRSTPSGADWNRPTWNLSDEHYPQLPSTWARFGSLSNSWLPPFFLAVLRSPPRKVGRAGYWWPVR